MQKRQTIMLLSFIHFKILLIELFYFPSFFLLSFQEKIERLIEINEMQTTLPVCSKRLLFHLLENFRNYVVDNSTILDFKLHPLFIYILDKEYFFEYLKLLKTGILKRVTCNVLSLNTVLPFQERQTWCRSLSKLGFEI